MDLIFRTQRKGTSSLPFKKLGICVDQSFSTGAIFLPGWGWVVSGNVSHRLMRPHRKCMLVTAPPNLL